MYYPSRINKPLASQNANHCLIYPRVFWRIWPFR